MARVYLTVKPSEEKGFSYQHKLGTFEGLFYDAERLLKYIAETIQQNPGNIIVLQNRLPDSDKAKKVLEIMVDGHNLALKLSGRNWNREARRALRR